MVTVNVKDDENQLRAILRDAENSLRNAEYMLDGGCLDSFDLAVVKNAIVTKQAAAFVRGTAERALADLLERREAEYRERHESELAEMQRRRDEAAHLIAEKEAKSKELKAAGSTWRASEVEEELAQLRQFLEARNRLLEELARTQADALDRTARELEDRAANSPAFRQSYRGSPPSGACSPRIGASTAGSAH